MTTHNLGSAKGALKYGWIDYVPTFNSDVICLQSLNVREDDDAAESLRETEYFASFSYGEPAPSKYSVGILSRARPEDVQPRLPGYLDRRGQWLRIKQHGVWFVSLYAMLEHQSEQHDAFIAEIASFPEDEPVVLCGDFNTIQDLVQDANQLSRHSGYRDPERTWVRSILQMGFVDAYRKIYPKESGYTWWARRQMFEENRGTRIDLQLVRGLEPVSAKIHRTWSAQRLAGGGSADHAPLTVQYVVPD